VKRIFRRWSGKVLCTLILATCAASVAYPQSSTLSVCSVIAGLRGYANRIVTVLGQLESGPEQLFLRGEGCQSPFVTEGYTWPSTLLLRYPGGPDTPVPLPFEADSPSIAAFQIALRQARARNELVVGCVQVTGMIQVREDYFITTRPNGQKRGHGFGHMNAFPAQLVIKSVDVKTLGSSGSGCK
jgi:hypothetical protein